MAQEEWIPGSKQELMSAIGREWKQLMGTVEKLTQAGKMAATDEGGWSPKDHLAHLGEWMNALTGYHMEKGAAHVVMRIPAEAARDWDMEVINPILFQRNKDRSLEEVLDEFHRTYEEMLAKLEAMSFDDLMRPRHANDPEQRPLLLWVLGDTTEHFAEHRGTIEKMLQ